jgi:hypothetical protein
MQDAGLQQLTQQLERQLAHSTGKAYKAKLKLYEVGWA